MFIEKQKLRDVVVPMRLCLAVCAFDDGQQRLIIFFYLFITLFIILLRNRYFFLSLSRRSNNFTIKRLGEIFVESRVASDFRTWF